MHSHVGFFTLPRELRDEVYEIYLTVDGGYTFNYETGKLTTANGQCIDMALAYTCKRAAVEMRGLDLQLNTINFSTLFSEEIRRRIGRFNALSQLKSEIGSRLLSISQPCIDERIIRYVTETHPRLLPVIHALYAGVGPFDNLAAKSWGETPSSYRRFVSETLKLIAAHPRFRGIVSQSLGLDWLCPHLPEFLAFSHSPWTLPTESHVDDLCRILERNAESVLSPSYWDREKYRLSAASAAISFLYSLSPKTRCHLRRIVLHEDHMAVSWPECHAQGLIPLCVENPCLRVQRKVNMWRNVFPASEDPVSTVAEFEPQVAPMHGLDVLESEDVTRRCLAPWIMETLALPSLGMPAQSFTLVLDGSPTLEATARVFEVVQRDAAWQTDFEACCSRIDIIPGSIDWAEARGNSSYILSRFPEALQDITNNKTSLVKCNFDPGTSWDTEQLKAIERTWTLDEWTEGWWDHSPKSFKTEPP